MLTEDPDVFCEMGGSMTSGGAMNDIEINAQAEKETGGGDAAKLVADQAKQKKDMEKQQQTEKKKIIEPQLKQLDTAMSKLDKGVTQGRQSTANGNDQLGALEKEMTTVNSLIGNLKKQL